MSSNARTARPTLSTRVAALEAVSASNAAALARIEVLLTGDAPAKAVTRKAAPAKAKARKAAPKAAPVKAPTKGAQALGKGGLTRTEWNRTLTAKARFAGGGAYKAVTTQWEAAQALRADGATPDEALASLIG